MWLACKIPSKLNASEQETLLDLLLGLSPMSASLSSTGDKRYALIALHSLSRYWKLNQLQATLSHFKSSSQMDTLQSPTCPSAHPLLEQLRILSRKFSLTWIAAPTAPSALWILENLNPQNPILSFYTLEEWIEALSSSSIKNSTALLEDFLHKKPQHKSELSYFTEIARDLGIHKFQDLVPFLSNHSQRSALVMRFGPALEKLLRRMQGADDVELKWHEPRSFFECSFSPQLEGFMRSENAELLSPIERVQKILSEWSERLQARRALLTGFQITLTASRRNSEHKLVVHFPKATRETKSFCDLFMEKWQKFCADTHMHAEIFEDEISEIHMRSSLLESDHDRQLSLFDPHREEVDEKWNVLVAQLRVRANQQVQIGGYRPFESFYPENSIEWVEWEEWSTHPPSPVMDHPRRPTLLLSKPCELPEAPPIQSEEDFISFVGSKNALMTLEKLRDPWRQGKIKASSCHFEEAVSERSYARVDGQWLFWDHHQQKIFLHGYFE